MALPESRAEKKLRYPESSVFYRALDRVYPRISHGEGVWLFDDAGKRYLDSCSGAFVCNIGHGVPEIAKAVSQQLEKVAYVNGTAFTTDAAEELALKLAGLSPRELNKFYFLSSGSEAVEAALKLARHYWVEKKRPQKSKIISQKPGYHGNTLLAMSVSARGHYKKIYQPWLMDCAMVPAPYAYRCGCGGNPSCPVCSGRVLEEAILKEGAETVAAFIMEPVGGSSTGASVPRADYFRNVREICDRYEVLLIADEVLTGAGRTGKWLAMEHYGVLPDIMTLGKGISGGYLPLSAVVAGEKIIDPIANGYGSFLHAQTFSHAPSICSAGLAAVRYIEKHGLVERAAKMGLILQKKLEVLKGLPFVGDVRGIGMLAGIEFVADTKTKEAFPRRLKFAETFTQTAQDLGLIVWPNVGHADGENGDLAMIAPPFTIAEFEIDLIVSFFKEALEKTASKIAVTGEIK